MCLCVCVCVCVCLFEIFFLLCPEASWFAASVEPLEDTGLHAQCRPHDYIHSHTHTRERYSNMDYRKDCDDQSLSEWEPLRECTHTHTHTYVHCQSTACVVMLVTDQ